MKIEKTYRCVVWSGYTPATATQPQTIYIYTKSSGQKFKYKQAWNYTLDSADNHIDAFKKAIQNWKDHHGLDLNETVWLQGAMDDGYIFTPLPKHLQNNEPIVPITSDLDGGKSVKPKYLVVEKGYVVVNKATGRKCVAYKDSNDRYLALDYEIVAEKPHADDDFSYTCGSDYCRCMQ